MEWSFFSLKEIIIHIIAFVVIYSITFVLLTFVISGGSLDHFLFLYMTMFMLMCDALIVIPLITCYKIKKRGYGYYVSRG